MEDSDIRKGDREIRKGLRRKRSKGSPGTEAHEMKKVKKQLPVSQDVPSIKSPANPKWEIVKSKERKKGQSAQPDQLTSKKKKERQVKTSRKPAPRPDARIIRPKDKEKYSEILCRVKKDVPPEKAHDCVDKIRRTATGDMLIILSKKTTDGAAELRTAIANLLGDEAQVLRKGPQEELEIKDLDETTKEEVLEALQRIAGEEHEITPKAIRSLRMAYGGTQTASVTVAATAAKKILDEHGKIKIGWVNYRAKRMERPIKCFRCWHYGHLATKRTSTVDRSKLCIKCTVTGNTPSDCKERPLCALCSEKKGNTENCAHSAGSSKCPVYKEVLQKVLNK
ncbi:uncharacterized protein LOC107042499 [Diachasma alloeum]|uniref:uncharacterized protein LOC107042499 n=1 Tax=Diachasma alloeum TaxID=454923 RepID=UPI0007383341|nr:uncharacterized protein LOC107042499 [Diachasma alloeum]